MPALSIHRVGVSITPVQRTFLPCAGYRCVSPSAEDAQYRDIGQNTCPLKGRHPKWRPFFVPFNIPARHLGRSRQNPKHGRIKQNREHLDFDKRLRELMLDKTEPKNRDEKEISGYRYVLDIIHESHDAIPITPGIILQLHRDLCRLTGNSFAGRWKDPDNVIMERNLQRQDGSQVHTHFRSGNPPAIERICSKYSRHCKDDGMQVGGLAWLPSIPFCCRLSG